MQHSMLVFCRELSQVQLYILQADCRSWMNIGWWAWQCDINTTQSHIKKQHWNNDWIIKVKWTGKGRDSWFLPLPAGSSCWRKTGSRRNPWRWPWWCRWRTFRAMRQRASCLWCCYTPTWTSQFTQFRMLSTHTSSANQSWVIYSRSASYIAIAREWKGEMVSSDSPWPYLQGNFWRASKCDCWCRSPSFPLQCPRSSDSRNLHKIFLSVDVKETNSYTSKLQISLKSGTILILWNTIVYKFVKKFVYGTRSYT